MTAKRKTAMLVGILYILGTAAGFLSVGFTGPVLAASDTLAMASTNEGRLVAGALLVLGMGFALAMIPVLMYPILKQHSRSLALGYVVFRGALETFT